MAKLSIDDLEPVAPVKSGKLDDSDFEDSKVTEANKLRSLLDATKTIGKAITDAPTNKGAVDRYVLPAVQGAKQGLSLGFADELKGAGDVWDTVKGFNPGGTAASPSEYINNLKNIPETYAKGRDAERKLNSDAAATNPNLFEGSKLASGMALPFGTAKTLGGAALNGAGIGIANAIGSSDKPLEDTSVTDVAIPGALGAAGGAVATKGGQFLGDTLKKFANAQALKAAGAKAGINNQLRDLGLSSEDDLQKLGGNFLKDKLIPWFGGKQSVMDRASGAMNSEGSKIGAMSKGADAAVLQGGPVAGQHPQPFDYARFGAAADVPAAQATSVADELAGQKAHALAAALENQGKRTPGSFEGAAKAKSDAWKAADFRDDADLSPKLYRDTVGAARDNIEQQLEENLVAQNIQKGMSPADAKGAAQLQMQKFTESNDKFGTAATANSLAKNYVSRNAAHKNIGITDLLAAAPLATGAMATGHGMLSVPAAVGTVLAKKGLEHFGPGFSANLANTGGNLSNAVGELGSQYGGRAALPASDAWTDLMKKDKK